MDRSLAQLRPLAWLLAAVLVLSLAALPISRAQARDLVPTNTWLDLADDEPALGDTITITANVERDDDEVGDVTGQVRFSAGTAEAGPFGTTLGTASLVGGTADLEVTIDESTLPPGTTDSFYVVADFLGGPAFEASSSDPVLIEVTVPDGIATTTVVTDPDWASAGEETSLTAAVEPVEATGTVSFLVDGDPAGTAEVHDGAATVLYTFPTGTGFVSVVATFEPDDGNYLPSTSDSHDVFLDGGLGHPGPASYGSYSLGYGVGCRPGPTGADPAARAVPPVSLFFNVTFPVFQPLFTFLPQFTYFNPFGLQFEACVLGAVFTGGRATEPTKVPVTCVGTDTGYQCHFELPGPVSGITLTPTVPIPAELAGQDVALESTLSMIDPTTGEATTLLQETSHVDVPERTVLTGRLAPVKSGITSAHRGQAVPYRLDVRNAGIVTATKVEACVSVGKGATIRAAKGATVRGRQACWTLPSLRSAKSVARNLTVVAPRKAGTLKLSAVVKPQRSQADPVRLTTGLPVR